MMSLILPPTIFYSVLLPNLKKDKQLEHFQMELLNYRSFIVFMFLKFRYGKGTFHQPQFYRKVNAELLQIDQYLQDVEAARERLKTKR